MPKIAPMVSRMRREQRTSSQFARFLVTGFINTIFSYLVFVLLIFLEMEKTVALGLSTLIGILFNFQTIGRFVFRNTRLRLLVRFFLAYGFIFVFNASALHYLSRFDIGPTIGQALLLPPVTLLSFGLNKFLVFRAKP